MKVSIVYSVALGTVRRIVTPDPGHDEQLDDLWHMPGPGEARIVIDMEDVNRMLERNHAIRGMHLSGKETHEIAAALSHDPAHVDKIKNGLMPAQELVNAHTGREPGPHDDLFMLVDHDGKVVRANLKDDPACHAVPWWPADHKLIPHPEGTHGWHLVEGEIVPPPEIPEIE